MEQNDQSGTGTMQPPPVKEESKSEPVKQEVKKFFIPAKVILKPMVQNGFRLGLEKTKEQFIRVPGVRYRWEPTKLGDTYLTGLDRLTAEERADCEKRLGKKLDDRFYESLSYSMEGSNPNGHTMDLTDAYEKVVYLAMIESPQVAESIVEYKTGKKAYADWYVENPEAEAESESKEISDIMLAMEKLKNLSPHKKLAFCKILEMPVAGLSPKVADNLLFKKLNAPGPNKKKIVAKFLEMCEWADDKIAVFEIFEDATVNNVIRRNSAQDWVYANEVLGSTKEQVISKLMMGENQGLRMAIKGKLLNR